MNWKNLEKISDLDAAVQVSDRQYVLLFKHSTTCPISHMAKMRLESKWDHVEETVDAYYLDLKTYRNISNEIAERFDVHHESPQVLLIKDGTCIYDASHMDITVDELNETIAYQGK
jgi:bacillithiol system protein YtxJ